ncbi:PaaX family transcriptional regulator [Microbacterium nymphoidis]|uniref:PaaX family transcriptional regulator n=1 Tax=Microbacterium nymphoidis TaxID=2898586 RepID=UPI001E4C9B94|nr:PaaX family transcriptional regulator [Microbacterium nymphoidis]MCD2498714.1 PaaX family transcriptional regulator [Microbacterium nymphoidis]
MSIAISPRTLIEGCFRADGVAPLDVVYDVGLALGLTEQTVRLAIRRMQAAGELKQIGRGRAGRVERTSESEASARLDDRLLRFAFAQDDGDVVWDGRWRMYGFSVPESARSERDALRATLQRLGASVLIPGLYVTPHDLGEELSLLLGEGDTPRRLIVAESDRLSVGGVTDAQMVAERLWPASGTLAAYEPLERELSASVIPSPDDQVMTLAAAIPLREAFGQALAADPLLPPELRTKPWRPSEVRRRFLSVWSALGQNID